MNNKNIFWGLYGGIFGLFVSFAFTNRILSQLFLYEKMSEAIESFVARSLFIQFFIYLIFILSGSMAGMSYKKIFNNKKIPALLFSAISFFVILSVIYLLDIFYYDYIDYYMYSILISGVLSAGFFFLYKTLFKNITASIVMLSVTITLTMFYGLFIIMISMPSGS